MLVVCQPGCIIKRWCRTLKKHNCVSLCLYWCLLRYFLCANNVFRWESSCAAVYGYLCVIFGFIDKRGVFMIFFLNICMFFKYKGKVSVRKLFLTNSYYAIRNMHSDECNALSTEPVITIIYSPGANLSCNYNADEQVPTWLMYILLYW